MARSKYHDGNVMAVSSHPWPGGLRGKAALLGRLRNGKEGHPHPHPHQGSWAGWEQWAGRALWLPGHGTLVRAFLAEVGQGYFRWLTSKTLELCGFLEVTVSFTAGGAGAQTKESACSGSHIYLVVGKARSLPRCWLHSPAPSSPWTV